MVPHPWRALRRRHELTISWADLGDDLGCYDPGARVITLHERLRQDERRCTLLHEMIHHDRQVFPSDPVLMAREEEVIEEIVARELISIRALGEALAWSSNLDEIQDELWVGARTLKARLDHLHPAERAYLRRRLGQKEDEA